MHQLYIERIVGLIVKMDCGMKKRHPLIAINDSWKKVRHIRLQAVEKSVLVAHPNAQKPACANLTHRCFEYAYRCEILHAHHLRSFASHIDNIYNQCVAFLRLDNTFASSHRRRRRRCVLVVLLLFSLLLWHNTDPFSPEFHRFSIVVGWETTITKTVTKPSSEKILSHSITNRIQCASIKHTRRHQTAFNTNYSGYACVISV